MTSYQPLSAVETGSFSKIAISLASPDTILSWSKGEVTKPEYFARRFSGQ
jgi:DNA-directed RNA polymerase beta' subunit